MENTRQIIMGFEEKIPKNLLYSLLFLMVSLLFWVVFFWQPDFTPDFPQSEASLSGKIEGGDFVVDTANGPLRLSDLSGKVVLLYFGYTFCPDICPTTLSTIAAALDELSEKEREKIAVVFISVDPARDTPLHLHDYVRFFHKNIIGATTSAENLANIARRYKVFYAKQGGDVDYAVDHSADTLVVTQQGTLSEPIPHGSSTKFVVETLRHHLANS